MQRVAYNSSGGSRSLSFRAAFGAGKLSSWRVKCSRSISIWSTYGAVQTYPCSSSVQFPTKNTGVRNIAAIHYKLISPRLYNFKCAFCLFLLLLVPILSQKQWGHRAALPMQWKVWLLIKKGCSSTVVTGVVKLLVFCLINISIITRISFTLSIIASVGLKLKVKFHFHLVAYHACLDRKDM